MRMDDGSPDGDLRYHYVLSVMTDLCILDDNLLGLDVKAWRPLTILPFLFFVVFIPLYFGCVCVGGGYTIICSCKSKNNLSQ